MDNIHNVDTYLKGHYNFRVTVCKEQGFDGIFKMWLNHNSTVHLLLISQLEKYGYKITYNTVHDWVVTTPKGKKITFKHDTGLCNCIPYFNLREHRDIGVTMLQTARKNFKGSTKKQVKKTILARKVHTMVEPWPDEKFKSTVRHGNLRNYDVKVEDITNARILFGPNYSNICYISHNSSIFTIYSLRLKKNLQQMELANFWGWFSQLSTYCWHIQGLLNMPATCQVFLFAVLKS